LASQDVNININSKLNDKGFQDLNRSISKVGASTQTLQKGFGNLQAALVGGLAGGLATVAAQLIPFTINAVKVGASLNNLRAGFAGTAKDMELLRKATAGTVGEAGLIALSNQATDLGLTLEEQAKLFSLAEDAGDKYGGSLEENFQKIVNATDGSAKGLRAVGISTTEYKKKVEELTKSMGVKIDEMEAEEQLQIRLQAIFELTGTTLDTVNKKTVDSADVLEQLGIAGEEVAAAFGSGLVKSFGQAGSAASGLGKELQALNTIAEGIGNFVGVTLAGLADKTLKMIQQDIKDINKVISFLNDINFFDNPVGLIGAEDAVMNSLKVINPMLRDDFTDRISTATKDFNKDTNKDTTKGGQTKTKEAEKEKEILTEIDRLQKEILAKEEIKQKYVTDNLTNTQAYLDLLAQILDLQNQLARAQEDPELSKLRTMFPLGEGIGVPRSPIEEVSLGATEEERQAAAKEEREKAFEDGKAIYSNITNILSILGIQTDSFVGKMINGFNSVLAILESIRAVNSILNMIPFLATGGSVTAGSPYIVGERGAELFVPNSNGQVFSNSQTMKILSQAQSSNAGVVNVYIGGTLDGMKFLKNNFPQYENLRTYKRVN